MFATQVLREDLPENVVEESDEGDVVGYIDIQDKKYEVKKGETKIGRDPTACGIVIDNFTVSKIHAVIESDGPDDTFIYDVNSTNQTKLGKKVLKPHCRYKLENNNTITLGNIIAKFTLPHDFSIKTEQKPSLDILNAPDDLEDIFELATQVSVPHSHSTEVPQPEKISENVHIFKVPKSVVPDIKVKTSPESPANPESKKLQLDSDDLLSRDCSSASIENSSIFSLSTQCQIIEPANLENKGDGVSKEGCKSDDDSSNIKHLLNDGEDDVLCMFMSLHSPSEQGRNALITKIKTEPVEPNISEIFDEKTQAVLYHTEETNNDPAVEFNYDLNNHNTPKSSTSNHKNVEINCQSTGSEIPDLSTEQFEDLIATQEFTTNPKVCVGQPISVEKPQEPITCPPEKPVDSSQPEETTENEDLISTQRFEVPDNNETDCTTENEDLICTQRFEVPERTETTCDVADELNDSNEDFLATQIYDFEKEELSKKPEESQETEEVPGSPELSDREDFVSTQIFEIAKQKSDKGPVEAIKKAASLVVCETPERNTETPTRISSDFTQINAEEDFISTQTFDEITSAWNEKPSDRSPRDEDDEVNDDEDFIATQSADVLMNNLAKTKSIQEPDSKIQTTARESSPDLLDSGFSAKTSEDITDTVTFENQQLQSPKASLLEYSEQIAAMFGNKENFPIKTETVDSSGDETESDLEIMYDKSDKNNEPKNKPSTTSEVLENSIRSFITHENDDNDSYVFQLEPETEIEPTSDENIQFQKERADNSDSDATDCEEIAVVSHKMSIKQELPDKVPSEESQVLASTPPNNFIPFENDGCAADEPSPTFEVTSEETINENQSLLQKDTENIVYETPAKIMRTEVGNEPFAGNSNKGKAKRQVDSPLKRPGCSTSEVDAIPNKKSKTETSDRKLRSGDKQLWKLWQAHDIEQIQPSRTRNSLNNISSGSNSNEPTSRRKTNVRTRKRSSDITSSLNEKVEPKRTSTEGRRRRSPKENCVEAEPTEECQRVLRRSKRNSDNRAPFETPRNSSNITRRRSSRFKNDDYFKDPCVNVVFTGFDCESLENIISDLGGKITNDLSSGDVVVADKVRRTVKFLSAIGLSLPIASPDWLLSCRAEKKFVNPWNFLLKDDESEKKWNFTLQTSLNRSMKAKLMEGLSVFATENAKPPVKDLLGIVKCCGGTPLFEPPDIWPKKTVIVSCLEDRTSWPLAKLRNVKIVHYEFILSGVLTQKLDFKTYQLR